MIRVLRVARASAVKASSETVNAIHAIVLTAPEDLRAQLGGLSKNRLARAAAALTEVPIAGPASAAQTALRSLGRRHEALRAEIRQFDRELERLTEHACPELTARFGVGPEVAAALLTAAGDNPGRLRSEASFANLTGTAPLQASSGKVVRHRLNRGGNRRANAALYRALHRRGPGGARPGHRATGADRPVEHARLPRRHPPRRPRLTSSQAPSRRRLIRPVCAMRAIVVGVHGRDHRQNGARGGG